MKYTKWKLWSRKESCSYPLVHRTCSEGYLSEDTVCEADLSPKISRVLGPKALLACVWDLIFMSATPIIRNPVTISSATPIIRNPVWRHPLRPQSSANLEFPCSPLDFPLGRRLIKPIILRVIHHTNWWSFVYWISGVVSEFFFLPLLKTVLTKKKKSFFLKQE